MRDNLNISYEEFPKEGIKVLTVGRGDEAIGILVGTEAKALYSVLIGDFPVSEINELLDQWGGIR